MDVDDECIHLMPPSTCTICLGKSPSQKKAPTSAGNPWEPYRDRYSARPETFVAYVDVWRRLSGAQQFPGGWSTFSRAANAEPAMDADLVSRAEQLMRLGGYECDPKVEGEGRRWRREGQSSAKYDALAEHLALIPPDQTHVRMTFAEIDGIVGGLPPSAFSNRVWWANDSKVEARAWRSAGWRVDAGGVDLNAGTVRFARGKVGGTRARRLGLE